MLQQMPYPDGANMWNVRPFHNVHPLGFRRLLLDMLKTLLPKNCCPSLHDSPYILHDSLICYKGRIWLGNNRDLHLKVISAMHSSAIEGHSGILVTYSRLKQLFHWLGIKQTVHDYIRSCSICQQAKPDRVKYPGLLMPLPVPPHAWHTISMDFIEDLPMSTTFSCIMVVVDKWSKYGHFIPLAHPFSAPKVAKVFLDNVYKLHGLPIVIISDRDKIFTSAFWQEPFLLSDTKLNMSSAYHPQSKGQTECVNQCLDTFLRCFVHACPKKWSQWLAVAEFWYNSCAHVALGKSPYEVLYGHTPRHFGITDVATISILDL